MTAAGQIVDEWATLINPGCAVAATDVHGITNADVRGAPQFGEIIGELTARLAGRALVAHNAPFDVEFLRLEYARAGSDLPNVPCLCTLETSGTYLPSIGRRRLTDCCSAAGIPHDGAHSAAGDARATAELLAFYLDPKRGPAPRSEHLALPRRAASVAWPSVARAPVAVVPRSAAKSNATPAEPGKLAALLSELRLPTTIESVPTPGAAAYVELLAEVFKDGILTDDEARALSDCVPRGDPRDAQRAVDGAPRRGARGDWTRRARVVSMR